MKNKLSHLFKVATLCLVVVVSGVVLTGCFTIEGPRGQQGPPGNNAPTVGVDVLEMLEQLWGRGIPAVDNTPRPDLDANEIGRIIGVDYYATFIEFVRSFTQGPPGENANGNNGNGGSGNSVYATNIAIRSAVDIIATRDRQVDNLSRDFGFNQAGAGVIYKMPRFNIDNNNATPNHYTGDVYIITNYHVVASRILVNNRGQQADAGRIVYANRISVRFLGIAQFNFYADMIGGSIEHDIAILRIPYYATTSGIIVNGHASIYGLVNSINRPIQPARIPNSWNSTSTLWTPTMPHLGTPIIAVGNPLGWGMGITEGIVSRQYENVTMLRIDQVRCSANCAPGCSCGRWQTYRIFRVGTGINPGNSGGGVFDARNGEFLGIVMSRAERQGSPILDIGHAIPLDIALKVADQIVARSYQFDYVITGTGEDQVREPLPVRATRNQNLPTWVSGQGVQPDWSVRRVGINVAFDSNGNRVITEDIRIAERVGNGEVLRTLDNIAIGYYVNGQIVNKRIFPVTMLHQANEIMLNAWHADHRIVFNFTP